MAVILPVNGISPQFGNNCFVAPNATVVGDVHTGEYGRLAVGRRSSQTFGKLANAASTFSRGYS